MQKAKKFLQSSRSKWISLALFIIVLSSNPGMLIAPEPLTNDIDSPMQPSYTGTPGLYRASYDFSNGLVGWESWGTSYPIKQITNYDMLGHHKTICFNDIGQSAWDSYGIKQTFDKGYDVGFVEFYCMASPNGSPQLNLVSDTGSYYLSFTPYYIQVNYGTSYNVPLNLEGQWNNLKLKWNYNTDQLTIYNNGVYISTLPLTSGSKMTGFWAFSWGNYYSKYWIIDDIGFSWDYNYKEGDNSQLKDTSGIYGGQYSRTCLNFYDDIVGQSPTSVSLIPTDTSQSIIVQDNGQKFLKLAHSVSESGSNVNSYGFIVTPSISLTKGRLDFYFTGTQYSKPCLNFVSNLGSYYVDLCDTSIEAYYGGSNYASLPINYNFKSAWNHIWFEWDCQAQIMAVFLGETESDGNYKGILQMPYGMSSINALWFFQWSNQYVNPANSPTSWSIDTITIHGIRDYNKRTTFDYDTLGSTTPQGTILFGSNTVTKHVEISTTSTGQYIASIKSTAIDGAANSYGFQTKLNCNSTIGSVDFWMTSESSDRPELAFISNTTGGTIAYYVSFYDTYIQTSLGNTIPHCLTFKQGWNHIWMDWDYSSRQMIIFEGNTAKTTQIGTLPLSINVGITSFSEIWFFSWANLPTEWSIDNINITINSPVYDVSKIFDFDYDRLSNIVELSIGLKPTDAFSNIIGILDLNKDSDNDGIPNLAEIQIGTKIGINDKTLDYDGDGVNNFLEYLIKDDPHNFDSDYNLVHDSLEDYDGDGLPNGQEFQLGSNPCSKDTDGDLRYDSTEINQGTDPLDNSDYRPIKLLILDDFTDIEYGIYIHGILVTTCAVQRKTEITIRYPWADNVVVECYDYEAPGNCIQAGINYAVANHFSVISMSFIFLIGGNLDFSSAIAAGITLVGGSGNDDSPSLRYPASVPEVIAVGGAVAVLGQNLFSRWSFGLGTSANNGSNYGYGLDLVDNCEYISPIYGTSFSTPRVSISITCMLYANPNLSPSQLRSILWDTADKYGFYSYTDNPNNPNWNQSGWNYEMGYGIMDWISAISVATSML